MGPRDQVTKGETKGSQNCLLLAILCDLFGMLKWPFGKVKWPPTRGQKGHFESPGYFTIYKSLIASISMLVSAVQLSSNQTDTPEAARKCDTDLEGSQSTNHSLICWFLSQGFAIIMSFFWGGLLILGAYFFVCKDRRSLLVKSLNKYHTGGEYPINAKWIHNRPLLLVWLIVGEVYRIYMWGFTKHQGEWFHRYDPRGISICAVQERHGTGIQYWILSRRHEHATLTYNIGFLQYHSFKKKQHPKQLNVNLLNIFHRIHVWYICLQLVDFDGKLGGK